MADREIRVLVAILVKAPAGDGESGVAAPRISQGRHSGRDRTPAGEHVDMVVWLLLHAAVRRSTRPKPEANAARAETCAMLLAARVRRGYILSW